MVTKSIKATPVYRNPVYIARDIGKAPFGRNRCIWKNLLLFVNSIGPTCPVFGGTPDRLLIFFAWGLFAHGYEPFLLLPFQKSN